MMASSMVSGEVLERSASRRLSQRQRLLRSQIEDLDSIVVVIQKNEARRVGFRGRDAHFDQGGKAD